jgi:pimeloyl-ACP methyl ester carboxylesterase
LQGNLRVRAKEREVHAARGSAQLLDSQHHHGGAALLEPRPASGRIRADVHAWPVLEGDVTETVAELVTIMSEIRPVATRVMAHALAEADLHDVLPAIDVPTLLLYGDADERSPLNVAEDLGDSIPTSRLVVMAGLGHVSYLESPERFSAEVRSFLRSLA